MRRIQTTIFAGLIAAVAASAGSIQIGGATGLTSNYITSNGGSVTGWSELGYSTALFQAASVTPTAGQTNSLPTGLANATMTDASGVVLNMINDASALKMFWASPGAAPQTTLVIPTLGIGNVQSVYMMLNDYAGYVGADPTISFNFSSGTITFAIPEVANGAGGIRSAVNCTAATGTGTIVCPNPSTVPSGNTVSSSVPTQVNNNTTSTGDKIVTKSLWSGTYTMAAGANNNTNDYFYNSTQGSSGNVMLDELIFTFPTSLPAGVLNSISLAGTGTPGRATTRLALSAITVNTTPEPSTVLLIGTGLALLGVGRFRTRKN